MALMINIEIQSGVIPPIRSPEEKTMTKTLQLRTEGRIGIWNIRNMYQSWKATNVIKEMTRVNIEMLDCSEVR